MGWKAFFQNLIQSVVTSLVGAGAGKLVEKMGFTVPDAGKSAKKSS